MTDRRKRLALLAAILGSFVAGLDATAVNVALPAIESDLGGGLAGQQWVSNAYLLTLGSLILVGGSLGDLYGERRIFTLGVVGFGVVSVVCALAPSIEVLVAGRALQGVFGALLTPSALAVIVASFPPDERGAAIGSWTAWGGIATGHRPAGRRLAHRRGDVALDLRHQRAVRHRHGDHRAHGGLRAPRARARGCTSTTSAPRSARSGWPGPSSPSSASRAWAGAPRRSWCRRSAGVAMLALFIVHEARTPHPMLPLGLFRRRNFAVGNLETLLMYGGLSAVIFFLVLFLQQVAGYDALQAGLATLPITIVMFTLSRRAGRMADRYGPRWFMGGGPLVAAAGLALLQRVDAHVDYVTRPAAGAAALLARAVGDRGAADRDRAGRRRRDNAGIASGVNNAIARVAGLLAVAALGAVVAGQFGATIDERLAGQRLSPAAQRIVNEAKHRTLTRADPDSLPAAEARVVTQRRRGRRGDGVPPRRRDRGRASWRSAGCSASSGSATRAARCPARAAPAASSRGPRSRPRARAGRCPAAT